MSENEGFPSIGQRVVLTGSHPYAGEEGEVTNSPGRVFNGWAIRLDNGYHIGADARDLQPASKRSVKP